MRRSNVTVELVRVIACLMVVTLHCNTLSLTEPDISRELLAVLLSDGVGIFFIISGFFMFKKEKFGEVLEKATIRIFFPALIMMYSMELLLFNNLSINSIISDGFLFKSTENMGYLWYIFSYMEIIVLWPILKAVTKDKFAHLWIIMLGLIFVLVRDINGGLSFNYEIYEASYILDCAILVLLGAAIYDYCYEKILKNKRIVRWLSLVGIILIASVRCMLQFRLFDYDITSNFWCWWYRGIAILTETLFVIFMLTFEIKNEKFKKLISNVGKCTFGIYLSHYPVFELLKRTDLDKKLTKGLENIVGYGFVADYMFVGIQAIFVFLVSYFLVLIFLILKDMAFRRIVRQR